MKKIITALLVLSTLFCLCACTEGSDVSQPESSSAEVSNTVSTAASEAESSMDIAKVTFNVKVVDGDGNAVAGVMMQLCKDTCIPAKTGDDGVASFNVEITDGYKLSVLSCPEGYSYNGDAVIYLESGITEYTVTLAKGE